MRVALKDSRWRRAAARLLLLALPLLISAQATAAAQPRRSANGAATLANYRERVRRAYELVERLALIYEGEDVQEHGGPEDVRGLLPAKEKVEWGGRLVEVDNSWVHEALEPLDSEEDDEKIASDLRALGGRLRALEARLSEADVEPAATLDKDAERGRLNSILRRPEFDRRTQRQQSAIQRMIEEFFEWLASLFPKGRGLSPGGSPRVSKWTLVAVGAICLLVLAYVGLLLWRRRGVKRKSPKRGREARVVLGEQLGADQTATDLLEEAERLARAGELRSAIRKAYVALLCELGDRGVVRLAQHKTNRDYLDAVRRAADPRLYTEMLPLTNDFELHWYGLRAASDADWQNFKTRCRTALDSGQ
ncbi:MAG: DUF4129 domain-containing protein [Acidobacteria bacterium]|nr:DUF4129 domain-containing protein [Acidobacteriota bacterium]